MGQPSRSCLQVSGSSIGEISCLVGGNDGNDLEADCDGRGRGRRREEEEERRIDGWDLNEDKQQCTGWDRFSVSIFWEAEIRRESVEEKVIFGS